MTERVLASTALFNGLQPAALAGLANASTEIRVGTGETLFRYGDPGDALFVVASGTLELRAETPGEKAQYVGTLAAGDWCGALAVLGDEPHSATVIAIEPTTVLRVSATACREVVLSEPEARRHFISAVERRMPSRHLRRLPLFNALPDHLLRRLDREAYWVRLDAGETLCRQGEEADALFIVVHGSLEVLVQSGHEEQIVSLIGRGEAVGEMALLSDEPRSATVRAVRDSELVRIPVTEFDRLREEPSIIAGLARTLATRLRQTTTTPRLPRTVRTIAVVPAGGGPIPRGFARTLETAVAGLGYRVARVTRGTPGVLSGVADDEPDSGTVTALLHEQEATNRFVIYECDPTPSAWTLRLLRQADLVIAAAWSTGDRALGAVEIAIAGGAVSPRTRREIVLLHADATARPEGTARWLRERSGWKHHHVRADHAPDFARLARWIGGTSLGVVLSGGGARGFAHIGALQAMRDQELAVDLIGGTSMGAVIAAEASLGWDAATMIERNRKGFVECAVLTDLTFPFVSLLRARTTVKLLKSLFGDVDIEDLWLPYFCVTTNLSRAEVVVHQSGPAWLWVRASSAVPGIAPPVPRDGDLLVDGGVLNNLPVDIMRQRCPGPVVAVDVSPAVELTTKTATCAEMSGWPHLWRLLNPWSTAATFPNVLEILTRTATMSSAYGSERTRAEADLYLHPPTDRISPLDWAAIDTAVEIGYRYASEKIKVWREAVALSPARPGSEAALLEA
jgi:NTE family protein/lysophospholipid hydrolase